MKISQITRRDIIDAITVEKIGWNGRLEEAEFLSRLYNLAALPSTDRRFKDAAGDIWQHRVNNFDWGDDSAADMVFSAACRTRRRASVYGGGLAISARASPVQTNRYAPKFREDARDQTNSKNRNRNPAS
jgi:hypothetical protein